MGQDQRRVKYWLGLRYLETAKRMCGNEEMET